MDSNRIITISRQFASGGHEVAKLLSEELKLPLFDKAAVAEASKEYGFYDQIMGNAPTTPATSSLLYSIAANLYPIGLDRISLEQRIILAEEETMRKLATNGPCIFVGRAADAIFRKQPGRISFFIHAPLDWRAERAAKYYDVPEARARSITKQMDRKRASYYAERSEHRWGNADTYHMSLDTSLLGMEKSAEQIIAFLRAVPDDK